MIASVVVYTAVSSLLATVAFHAASRASLESGTGGGERAWIDRAVGADATVAAIWSGRGEGWRRHRRIWVNEFFNRSVGPVYYLREPLPFNLPETRVRLRGRALVLPTGQPLSAEYVLSDGPALVGERVAARPEVGLVLYRVGGPVQLAREATR